MDLTDLEIVHTRVFINGPNGGNPCPVVIAKNAITQQQGSALAKHFNAETIVIDFKKSTQSDFSLRFFMPNYEVDMCVHGTIAAVTVKILRGDVISSPVKISTSIGHIFVQWKKHQQDIIVSVYQLLPEFSKINPSLNEVSAALGVSKGLITNEKWPIQSVSTSRRKLIIPLANEKVLNQLEPDFELLWSLCEQYKTTGFYPFSFADGFYYARQFPNCAGYNEDPATGVAASALGVYLAKYNKLSDGWYSFKIRQGDAMHQPSLLNSKVMIKNSVVAKTAITGIAQVMR